MEAMLNFQRFYPEEDYFLKKRMKKGEIPVSVASITKGRSSGFFICLVFCSVFLSFF